MDKPTLLIMAAGMGSRYGGLKQMDPMDDEGNVIMDYSLFDAYRAGFRRIIFVIKKENHGIFKEVIGDRTARHFKVDYAFQDLNDIPGGFEVPEGRVKPWGTAHAVYSARALVNGPIAVINADDYYGVLAFKQIYDFLSSPTERGGCPTYTMVGYHLKNTVSEQGHVARGVCEIKDGKLVSVTERTKIEIRPEGIAYSEDDGASWTPLPTETIVSMNMWGFTKDFMDSIISDFPEFLKKNLPVNPVKCEYFVPFVVDDMLKKGQCEVEVLTSKDKWYGVTYKEDKPIVMQAFRDMKANGIYPVKLREDTAWK